MDMSTSSGRGDSCWLAMEAAKGGIIAGAIYRYPMAWRFRTRSRTGMPRRLPAIPLAELSIERSS